MGISVLLVEDKEQMLQIAEHYLQSDYMDFTITRVNSGKDALQRFESGSYDLVIFGTDISENDKNALISMLDETKRECQFILLTERGFENERSKELSAFKLITEASVREMSINDFCHHVLTGIIEGMGFDSGSLRLYNSAKETLEPVAIYGYSISEAEQIKTERIDDESMLVSYIARTGIPLFVPRVRESEIFKRFKNRFEVFKAESVISYPIFGKGGQLLGVITLSAKTQGRVTERNQDFFETVAELLAFALEKKYAEILLAESEEKYRTFVENSLEGIIVYDRENLIYFNPRVPEILGIEHEDVSSFTLDSVIELIHPDDRKKAIELFGRVLESEQVDARNELRFITPRGKMIYVDTYTRILNYQSKIAYITILLDVTERHQREQERQRHQRELELYASILQHDIGNDLQLIQQYTDIIESSLGESPTETRKLINSLNAVIDRTGGLLKAFTLKEDTHYTGFVGFLEDIINNTRLTYPDAEIHLVKSDDVNEIPANIGRLLPVVFENLVRNSIQHVQTNVKIVIEVTATPYQIEIRFSDDGPGIPNEFRDVIFKKRLSTGTGGFGLYLSQQIINAYNGEIELEDTEIGTSFIVRLPLSN